MIHIEESSKSVVTELRYSVTSYYVMLFHTGQQENALKYMNQNKTNTGNKKNTATSFLILF